MLRPLRKVNAEMRRVLNKALKTEAHSPLCKLYIYIYFFFFFFLKATLKDGQKPREEMTNVHSAMHLQEKET